MQEVSDRVEKSDSIDYVLRKLEHDGEKIVKCDWKNHIHEEVASDLKKYRSYHGSSVRDLLRALRNKVSFILEAKLGYYDRKSDNDETNWNLSFKFSATLLITVCPVDL